MRRAGRGPILARGRGARRRLLRRKGRRGGGGCSRRKQRDKLSAGSSCALRSGDGGNGQAGPTRAAFAGEHPPLTFARRRKGRGGGGGSEERLHSDTHDSPSSFARSSFSLLSHCVSCCTQTLPIARRAHGHRGSKIVVSEANVSSSSVPLSLSFRARPPRPPPPHRLRHPPSTRGSCPPPPPPSELRENAGESNASSFLRFCSTSVTHKPATATVPVVIRTAS